MLRNKLYDYLHKYLAEYLFGFDKSQLEVAILSGTSSCPSLSRTNRP